MLRQSGGEAGSEAEGLVAEMLLVKVFWWRGFLVKKLLVDRN